MNLNIEMFIICFVVTFLLYNVLGRTINHHNFDAKTWNQKWKLSKEANEQVLFTKQNINSFAVDYKDYVKFFLYTKQNIDNYEQLILDDKNTIASSNYETGRPTYFVIHGYMDNVNSGIIQSIKNGILGQIDSNVIAVDWSKITSDIFYHIIAQETPEVGRYIGKFIDFLVENGDTTGNVHLIGHSLGAQAAGFAGKFVTSGKLKRISGLDAALPGFEGADKNNRIDAGDADFVDCIHTCAGFLGYLDPICKADFYPNGGHDFQPGCLLFDFGVCSHGRSHEYYAESILPNHKFKTQLCTSIPSDGPSGCVNSEALMGFPASKQYSGIFYSETNSAYPFSKDVELSKRNNETTV